MQRVDSAGLQGGVEPEERLEQTFAAISSAAMKLSPMG